jgi:hypothetical protein
VEHDAPASISLVNKENAMRYEIWSNVSYRLVEKLVPDYRQFMDGYEARALMIKTAEGEVPSLEGDVSSALEDLYMLFNSDERPNRKIVHSLSVGDVVRFGESAYSVELAGFKKLDFFDPETRAGN